MTRENLQMLKMLPHVGKVGRFLACRAHHKVDATGRPTRGKHDLLVHLLLHQRIHSSIVGPRVIYRNTAPSWQRGEVGKHQIGVAMCQQPIEECLKGGRRKAAEPHPTCENAAKTPKSRKISSDLLEQLVGIRHAGQLGFQRRGTGHLLQKLVLQITSLLQRGRRLHLLPFGICLPLRRLRRLRLCRCTCSRLRACGAR